MGKKFKDFCLIITGASFVMMIASLIIDIIPSTGSNQRLSDFMSDNIWMVVLPSIISLAFALVYILKDGTKKAAFFYKGFIFTYLVSQVIFILSVIGGSYPVLSTDKVPIRMIILLMAWIIEYSMLLFLAFVPNLGKRKSLILALVAVVMNICIIIMFFKLGFSLSILLRNISKILIILLLYLLVVAKYKDKDARGAK